MNWIDEPQANLKRNRKVLFSKNSVYLQDLLLLLQEQNHRTITLWAFDLAAESIAKLSKKYPDEKRPQKALTAAQDWAA